jgi:hypothetical protein
MLERHSHVRTEAKQYFLRRLVDLVGIELEPHRERQRSKSPKAKSRSLAVNLPWRKRKNERASPSMKAIQGE